MQPALTNDVWRNIFDILFNHANGSFETAIIVAHVSRTFRAFLKRTKNVYLHLSGYDVVSDLFANELFGMKHLQLVFKYVPLHNIRGFMIDPYITIDKDLIKGFPGILIGLDLCNLVSLSLPKGITADSVVPILSNPAFQSSIRNFSISRINGSDGAKAKLRATLSSCPNMSELAVCDPRASVIYKTQVVSGLCSKHEGALSDTLPNIPVNLYQSPVLAFENVTHLSLDLMNQNSISRHVVVPETVQHFSLGNTQCVTHIVFINPENIVSLRLENLSKLEEIGTLGKSGLRDQSMFPPCNVLSTLCKQELVDPNLRTQFYDAVADVVSDFNGYWRGRLGDEETPRVDDDDLPFLNYSSGRAFGSYSFYSPGQNPNVGMEKGYALRRGGDVQISSVNTSKRDLKHFKCEHLDLSNLPSFRFLSHLACFLQSPKLKNAYIYDMKKLDLGPFVEMLPKIIGDPHSDPDDAMCPLLESLWFRDIPDLQRKMASFFSAYVCMGPANQKKINILPSIYGRD